MGIQIDLNISDVEDKTLRDNFQKVKDRVEGFPFLRGTWRFQEVAFTASGTFSIAHQLGFVPKDVILTSSVGAGVVTFHYDAFTRDNLSMTTTGPVTVRFFVGRADT